MRKRGGLAQMLGYKRPIPSCFYTRVYEMRGVIKVTIHNFTTGADCASGGPWILAADLAWMPEAFTAYGQIRAQAQAQAPMASKQDQSRQGQHQDPRQEQQYQGQSQNQQQYWSQYQQSPTQNRQEHGLSQPQYANTHPSQGQDQHVSHSSSSRTTPGACSIYRSSKSSQTIHQICCV